MKHTIIILLCFLCGHAYTLQAEDANAQQYQDSILKVAQAMQAFFYGFVSRSLCAKECAL